MPGGGLEAMMEQSDSGQGFTVIDGAALVTGAAVASIHLRSSIRSGLSGTGWVLIWGTFALVALTAAGPFLFLVRRYGRRLAGYPMIGDRLWAMLGVPWLLTAVLQSAGPGGETVRGELVGLLLGVGLAVICLLAVATLLQTWVLVSPEQAARTASGPWTNRVGLALSVAWPVQCGLAMVVLG